MCGSRWLRRPAWCVGSMAEMGWCMHEINIHSQVTSFTSMTTLEPSSCEMPAGTDVIAVSQTLKSWSEQLPGIDCSPVIWLLYCSKLAAWGSVGFQRRSQKGCSKQPQPCKRQVHQKVSYVIYIYRSYLVILPLLPSCQSSLHFSLPVHYHSRDLCAFDAYFIKLHLHFSSLSFLSSLLCSSLL